MVRDVSVAPWKSGRTGSRATGPDPEWSGPVCSKDSHAPPSSGGEGESRVETVHVFKASFDIEPDAIRALRSVGAVQSEGEQGCPAGMSSIGFQLGGEAFPFVARVVVDLGFGEGVVSIYARGMIPLRIAGPRRAPQGPGCGLSPPTVLPSCSYRSGCA